MATYAEYINTSKVVAIISGILLSIAIGFTVAAFVQYIARIMFTFKYKEKVNYFGSLWGGIAFSAIVYFLFIKGAKGSSLLTPEMIFWFKENTAIILLVSLIGSTVIFQILYWLFKLNILKVVVMAGTFSLAMAFAGNDLVNFIGVPLAGLESFQIFQASGSGDPEGFAMGMLRNPVQTPTLLLIVAGGIMVATLFINKKSRNVTKTTINLGRQEEGDETFESSMLARGMVFIALQLNKAYTFIVPRAVLNVIDKRFEQVQESKQMKDKPAFDLVRASVILIVASVLITIGTNLKLPLSTTYITFMVAMGASLADRAWGRESAVYRVSGVVTVVGGWFFTALIAFSVAGIVATIIYFGGLVAIIMFIGLAFFFVYKTHIFHKKKEKEEEIVTAIEKDETFISTMTIYKRCEVRLITFTSQMANFYEHAIIGLVDEKRKKLNKLGIEMKEFQKEIKTQRKLFDKTIKKLDDTAVEAEVFSLQIFGQMKEIHGYMKQLQFLCYDYVDNSHPPFLPDEKEELITLSGELIKFFDTTQQLLKKRTFAKTEKMDLQYTIVQERIVKLKVEVIHKLKKTEISTRKSMAIMDLMNLTSIILDHTKGILEIQRKFSKKLK